MPTAPSPSPTTVRAARPRIRPPFTTLVTRFTATIFSFRPSVRCSPPCILGCILAIVFPLETRACVLELETGLSSGLGKRLDPAVVSVSRSVERDSLDAQALGLLGDPLADRGGRVLVAALRNFC